MTYEEELKVLHSDFDIETHKKTFINYLEVVITYDGKVHYAVPSHQEFAIQLAMKMYGITREQIYNFKGDLTDLCKCAFVRSNQVYGYINNNILKSLKC